MERIWQHSAPALIHYLCAVLYRGRLKKHPHRGVCFSSRLHKVIGELFHFTCVVFNYLHILKQLWIYKQENCGLCTLILRLEQVISANSCFGAGADSLSLLGSKQHGQIVLWTQGRLRVLLIAMSFLPFLQVYIIGSWRIGEWKIPSATKS
jgi:hypothetical protein